MRVRIIVSLRVGVDLRGVFEQYLIMSCLRCYCHCSRQIICLVRRDKYEPSPQKKICLILDLPFFSNHLD